MKGTMEGGGRDGDVTRPGVERREQHQKPFLPLDIVLEIAARSDPATLVRCAATCRDARRRVRGDQSFHRRLRLRHAADGRFVPSLLRRPPPWSSQTWDAEKRWQPYLLLGGGNGDDAEGGGGASGRPFQVLKANLVMSEHHRYLETQTFSSESGTWGTYAKLRAPHFHGSKLVQTGGGTPLVVGGAVHWLCVTDAASYVLRLNISTTPAQVTVTALPASFPRPSNNNVWTTWVEYLLATATSGEGLMVLVADHEKISAWVQTATKPTAKWKPRAEVVVEHEAMLRFRNISRSSSFIVRLHWFAERSGFVLVYLGVGYGFFLLDLPSKRSSGVVLWASSQLIISHRFCSIRDGSVILGSSNIY